MSLRRKTISAIIVTMASLIVILYAASRFILLASFGRLEESDTRQHTQRALAALSDDLAQLDSTVSDWAPWDDTYAFVENLNEDYIKANLADSTFATLRLNLMLFVNTNGRAVFSQGFDLQTEQQTPVAPDVIRPILANASLVHYTDPNSTANGIVALPDGVMLVASHPILTSAHEGPIRGTLIFGRYLNSAEIDRLASLTHLSVSLEPLDAPDAPAVRSALSNTTSIAIRPADERTVAGYTLLTDVGGQPALILQVSVPRSIYTQGQIGVSYFVLALVAVGLVFGVGASLFLDRLILRRLGQLSAGINRIRASGDLTARLPSAGQDEVAGLGQAINGMLTTLRQSAETLRESEERYRAVFDGVRDAILVETLSGEILDANASACEMYRMDRATLLSKTVGDLVPPEQPILGPRDPAGQAMLERPIETINVRADGERFPIELSGRLQSIGGETALLVVVRDITERKQAEARTQALASLGLKLSSANTPEEAARIIVETADQLLGWDACFLEWYVPEQDQVIPVLTMDIIEGQRQVVAPAYDSSAPATLVRRMIEEGPLPILRDDRFTPDPALPPFGDTSRRSASLMFVPVRDGTRIVGVLSIQSYRPYAYSQADLNLLQSLADHCGGALNRIRAEAALHESERRFRALIENSSDIIALIGADANLAYVSPSLTPILGYTAEEVIGHNAFEFIHPDDQESIAAKLSELLEAPNRVRNVVYRVQHKDSSWRWVEATGSNLLLEPSIAAVVVNFRDITGRVQAEAALTQAEQRYRNLFEEAPVMYVITHSQAGLPIVVDCNRLFLDKTGYTRDEVQNRPLSDFYTPTSRARLLADGYQRALAGDRLLEERELLTRDGRVIATLLQTGLEWGAEGQVIGTRAMYLDITERGQAEEALRDSERRERERAAELQTLMDTVPAAIWIAHDQMCQVITGNRTGYELLHLPPDSNTSLTAPEDQRPAHFKIYKDGLELPPTELPIQITAATGVEIREFEFDYVLDDGAVIHMLGNVMPLFDEQGRPRGAVGAFVDITERRQMEEALRASEEKYRTVLQQSVEAIYLYDAETLQILEVNSAFLQLTGYTAEDIKSLTPYDLVMHERASFDAYLAQVLSLGGFTIGERVWRRKDGSRLDVDVSANKIQYGGRQIIFVVARDITERKRAEEKLSASEAELRALFAAMHDVVLVIDRDGIYRKVAPTNPSLLYKPPDELLGKSLRDIFPPEEAKVFTDAVQRVLKTRQNSQIEYELVIGERPTWFQTSITPMTEDSTLWVARDVTERKRAEEELQQEMIERQRIEAAEREQWEFAEALRDTAAVLNSSLYVDEVLDRILDNVGRVTPYDATNIMLVEDGVFRVARERGYAARGVQDQVLALKASIADFAILRRVKDTQQPVAVADTHADPDWCAIPPTDWVRSYAAAPIRIEGQVIGFLNLDSATAGFFTSAHAERLQAFADQAALAIRNAQLHSQIQHYADELELRVAERTHQLTEANQKLQELDRMKDQFVSNVSHELRTPLTSIMLQLELLQHGKPDKRDVYLGTLRRESDRLRKMIEDLLDLSRLDRAVTPMQPAPTDLNQLLGQVVADRSALATARGLSLEFAPTPDLPPALVDVSMLIQVISNLVTNALNYTPSGGHVTVTTAKQPRDGRDWVTFTVRDTGPGISAKDLPHLFERFYRGEAGRKASAPGTGLGLAICQEIVMKHGGQITVESEPGQGAAFTVWLRAA